MLVIHFKHISLHHKHSSLHNTHSSLQPKHSRVSHFGKKFELSSVNPGSHSNRYIREVSSFSEFSSNIYYSPIDMQILLYIDIFALREDLICHFSITYCLRYQGDRVLFTAFLPLSLL